MINLDSREQRLHSLRDELRELEEEVQRRQLAQQCREEMARLLDAGDLALRRQDFAAAEAVLRQVLDNPDLAAGHEEARTALIYAYRAASVWEMEAGHWNKARDYLQRWAAFDPQAEEPCARLAEVESQARKIGIWRRLFGVGAITGVALLLALVGSAIGAPGGGPDVRSSLSFFRGMGSLTVAEPTPVTDATSAVWIATSLPLAALTTAVSASPYTATSIPTAVGQPQGIAPTVGQPQGIAPTTGQPQGIAPTVGQPQGIAPTVGQPQGIAPTTGQPQGIAPTAPTVTSMAVPTMTATATATAAPTASPTATASIAPTATSFVFPPPLDRLRAGSDGDLRQAIVTAAAPVWAVEPLPAWLAEVAGWYGLDPSRRFIVVSQRSQKMTLWDPTIPIRTLPVSTGDDPEGYFTPPWVGPVGHYVGTIYSYGVYADDAWYLFESLGSILIHGGPYRLIDGVKVYEGLDAIGNYPTSHGCIRLLPEDAHWFTEWGPEGVPMVILARESSW